MIKNSKLRIRVEETSFLHFEGVLLSKILAELEKKPEDEHDETKPYLHRDCTIVILECFVMNYSSNSFGRKNRQLVQVSSKTEQKLKQNILYVAE